MRIAAALVGSFLSGLFIGIFLGTLATKDAREDEPYTGPLPGDVLVSREMWPIGWAH